MVGLAAVTLDVAAAVAQSPGSPAAPLPPEPPVDVHWVVFVDDLHLDFRSTGRLRGLPRAVARDLVRDDDLVSIASSGPSSLAVRDTRGATSLADASRRVTGNALRDEDIVRLDRPSQVEVDYRTRMSLEAAIGLLDSVRTSPWSRRRVMLYLSRGYAIGSRRNRQESGMTLLEETIAAAMAADVVVIALEPAGTPTPPPIPSPLLPATLRRLAELRAASLGRLVAPSGGFVAVDVEAFRPELFGRINALVGR